MNLTSFSAHPLIPAFQGIEITLKLEGWLKGGMLIKFFRVLSVLLLEDAVNTELILK